MDDTINGVMEDDEEESEEIMNKVLDEIGIELNSQVRLLSAVASMETCCDATRVCVIA